ncbi:MAG TPA: hypothetical protein DCF33_19260, partial [Saprospirales bacterium]|nr:hypothetical protein [Saprospirales bacterium]
FCSEIRHYAKQQTLTSNLNKMKKLNTAILTENGWKLEMLHSTRTKNEYKLLPTGVGLNGG